MEKRLDEEENGDEDLQELLNYINKDKTRIDKGNIW